MEEGVAYRDGDKKKSRRYPSGLIAFIYNKLERRKRMSVVCDVLSCKNNEEGGCFFDRVTLENDDPCSIKCTSYKGRKEGNEQGKCQDCGDLCTMKSDKGLKVGFYCDDCFSKMVHSCRQQSW